jgi:lipopolysaccharide transport system permease protein
MAPYINSVWSYRHFIISSIRTEFRARFARSKVAFLWVVAQPLIQVALYAVVLSSVLLAKLPGVENKYGYAVYLLGGIAAWGLFSEILSRCLNIFIEYGNTLKKIVFPRICLPLIVVGSALVNNLLLLFGVAVALVMLDSWPGFALLHLIPLTAIVVALGAGLGLFLGTLNVFMRDVGQVVNVLLQLWFWFTPIVYPIGIVPAQFKAWAQANPMTPVVDGYQRVLLYGQAPQYADFLPVISLAIGALVISLVAFRRAAPDMADVL